MTKRWLEGRVAVVTGAGARPGCVSIGSAHAMRLASEGALVVVNNRLGVENGGLLRAEDVVGRIRAAGGQAVANADDVSDFQGARRIVECAMDHFGAIDILINNAGFVRPRLIWDMDEADFDDIVHVHLKGTFNMVRQAVPHMISQKRGIIVNTSSNSGQGHYGNSAYSAAKEGVIGFTRALAKELAPHGLRANSIRPAAFAPSPDNPMLAALIEIEKRYGFPTVGDIWISKIAPDADLDPIHIANFVAWLCTDNPDIRNGADFEVQGAQIGVMAHLGVERTLVKLGGWSIEDLNRQSDMLGR